MQEMQEETLHLKGETARLKADMARLKDETSRLQTETIRLKDQLALRDAAVAAETARSKTDSKIDSARQDGDATTSALKGDLLGAKPQRTEIQKTPQEKKVEAKVTDSAIDRPADMAADGRSDLLRHADENASEPKAHAAERAWRRLIDFAARMKNDLSGSAVH
jgi:predicted nuclease with TOPRIM domain